MKLRLPFSSKMREDFLIYLISDWSYSSGDALYIVEFISTHPKIFRIEKASPLRKHLNKFNKYTVYSIIEPDRLNVIYPPYLLKFIEDDCLPF